MNHNTCLCFYHSQRKRKIFLGLKSSNFLSRRIIEPDGSPKASRMSEIFWKKRKGYLFATCIFSSRNCLMSFILIRKISQRFDLCRTKLSASFNLAKISLQNICLPCSKFLIMVIVIHSPFFK